MSVSKGIEVERLVSAKLHGWLASKRQGPLAKDGCQGSVVSFRMEHVLSSRFKDEDKCDRRFFFEK